MKRNNDLKAKHNSFMGIPAKTVERFLSELKRFGFVVYKGSSNSGGYYIANQDDV